MIHKYTLLGFVFTTIVTLGVGLRPFNFNAKNHVCWLGNENGIQFQKGESCLNRSSPGVVYSPTKFDVSSMTGPYQPVTIELYLEPHAENSINVAHILAFGDGRTIEPFIIGQWKTDLEIIRQGPGGRSKQDYKQISIADALRRDVKTCIAITSGHERTDIYLDGDLVKTYETKQFVGVKQFSQHLMLGNASDCGNQWVGTLFGLALYRDILTSGQIHSNYLSWTQSDQVDVELSGNPIALYTFNEKQGSGIANQACDKNHLIIPKRYRPLKRIMLQPFWKHEHVDRRFLFDVVINVLGFIPFAFLLIHNLNMAERIPPGNWAIAVILAGGGMSLAIEISQAYLPIRHSSLLDLICNTCGAFLGIVLYKIIYRRPSLSTLRGSR